MAPMQTIDHPHKWQFCSKTKCPTSTALWQTLVYFGSLAISRIAKNFFQNLPTGLDTAGSFADTACVVATVRLMAATLTRSRDDDQHNEKFDDISAAYRRDRTQVWCRGVLLSRLQGPGMAKGASGEIAGD
jgi:hypothetical protein